MSNDERLSRLLAIAVIKGHGMVPYGAGIATPIGELMYTWVCAHCRKPVIANHWESATIYNVMAATQPCDSDLSHVRWTHDAADQARALLQALHE